MTAIVETIVAPSILMLPVAQLTLGLDFRVDDDPADLADLATSIAELGVLQALVDGTLPPLVITADNPRYEEIKAIVERHGATS